MRWLLYCLALICLCCSPRHPAAVKPPVPSGQAQPSALRTLTVSVDADFTPPEVALIHTAAALLMQQTGGKLAIQFQAEAAWKLQRLGLADWRLFVADMHFDSLVLGFCDRSEHELFLIPARIDSVPEFVHVTMHEFLHAAGVDHVGNPDAIMWPTANEDSGVVMTNSDLLAFCAIVHC